MNKDDSKVVIAGRIREAVLPGAVASRTRMLDRTLNSLTTDQLEMVERAVNIAVANSGLSYIRDAIESRDMTAISATARWERVVRLSPLEKTLDAEFADSDNTYDYYSPRFDAHVEAYVTYHDYCNRCTQHDRSLDDDEEGQYAPENAHYVDYLQDYDLMEAVEQHPERVSELVRLAAERGGISPEVLEIYLNADHKTLAEGAL